MMADSSHTVVKALKPFDKPGRYPRGYENKSGYMVCNRVEVDDFST